MNIFYSGRISKVYLPEQVLGPNEPCVMLTYYEIHDKQGDTIRRFHRHVERKSKKGKKNEKRKG